MTSAEILKYLQEEIHTTVAASADREGLPVTCAIDIMDADEEGIYFLTAKGKGFYQRLKANGYIAMTGMKGKDTMSCTAVSVRGKVRELGGGSWEVLAEAELEEGKWQWMRLDVRSREKDFLGYMNPVFRGKADSRYRTFGEIKETMEEP